MQIKATRIRVVLGDIRRQKVDAVAWPRQFGEYGRMFAARRVVAVATAGKDGLATEVLLRQACRAVFKQAQRYRIKTLVFPALGVESGFSGIGSAKILAQETMKFLKSQKTTSLKEVVFCLATLELQKIFEKNLVDYIRHIQEDLGQGPYVTVDAIIEYKKGVVLIERSNPPYGWALPGGFLDYGESVEAGVMREVKEETGLRLKNLKQFHTYSDPRRDPRFHTVTVVFTGRGVGRLRAGDDAQGAKVVPRAEILKGKFAFDHGEIIREYLKSGKR